MGHQKQRAEQGRNEEEQWAASSRGADREGIGDIVTFIRNRSSSVKAEYMRNVRQKGKEVCSAKGKASHLYGKKQV